MLNRYFMNVAKYKNVVIYPLTLWLIIYIISFLFGYTEYPDLTQQAMLNDASPFIMAIAFGFWIGSESRNSGFNFHQTMANTLIVSFVVGAVAVLLTVVLINTSPVFLTYATQFYAKANTVTAPIINLVVSTWGGNIFTAVPAAAAAYSFLNATNNKKKK